MTLINYYAKKIYEMLCVCEINDRLRDFDTEKN